jgi:drug/metabolite transporter (DMT)-like permease
MKAVAEQPGQREPLASSPPSSFVGARTLLSVRGFMQSVPRARQLSLLVLTVLVWGYNWVPLKIAADAVDPWWLSAWRVGIGAVTLFVVLALSRRSLAPPPGRAFIGVGLTQVAGLVVFSTLALHVGGVGNTVALIFTMPLFTAIFAYVLLSERLSPARLVWLLVAAAGIAVVASGIRPGHELLAAIFALAGGASWALGNVLQRRAAYRIDLLRLVAWQQLVAAIPLIGLALAFGRASTHLSVGVGVAAIFAGIVGSGIAWLWWGKSLSELPANTVALASFAIPLIAALSGWIQLGNVPPTTTLIGLGIVVCGLSGSVLSASAGSMRVATPERAVAATRQA